MRISDWSSDVCSSDLCSPADTTHQLVRGAKRIVHFIIHDTRMCGSRKAGWLNKSICSDLQHTPAPHNRLCSLDRKSVVQGKSVSVRVDLGGRRIIKKKKTRQANMV